MHNTGLRTKPTLHLPHQALPSTSLFWDVVSSRKTPYPLLPASVDVLGPRLSPPVSVGMLMQC